MPAKTKDIEEAIRKRFIEVVNEINAADDALSIARIMEKLGDYQQSFTQMHAGKRYPTLKNVVLLCQYFGVNPAWLLFGTGNNGLASAAAPLKRLEMMEQEIQMLKLVFEKPAGKGLIKV